MLSSHTHHGRGCTAFDTASSGPTVTTPQTITSLAFMSIPFPMGLRRFLAFLLKGAEYSK